MSAPAGAKPIETGDRLSYRICEASKLTGIPKSSIHDAIRLGRLRAVRLGKIVLIPADELKRLLS